MALCCPLLVRQWSWSIKRFEDQFAFSFLKANCFKNLIYLTKDSCWWPFLLRLFEGEFLRSHKENKRNLPQSNILSQALKVVFSNKISLKFYWDQPRSILMCLHGFVLFFLAYTCIYSIPRAFLIFHLSLDHIFCKELALLFSVFIYILVPLFIKWSVCFLDCVDDLFRVLFELCIGNKKLFLSSLCVKTSVIILKINLTV